MFIYGAAFKPELANERLVFVIDSSREKSERETLRMTLLGPSAAELASYRAVTPASIDGAINTWLAPSQMIDVETVPRA